MQFLRNISLKRKQTLIIMLTSGVALLLAVLAFATLEILASRRAMVSNLSTLAEIVGNNSTAALDFNEPKDVQETLAGLKAEPNIIGAVVYAKAGAVFAAYDRANDAVNFQPPPIPPAGWEFKSGALRLSLPIVRKGDAMGTVYVESDLHALYSRLQQDAVIAASVLFAASLVALLLSAWLQRVVSEPILELVATARAIAQEKHYSLRAVRGSQDELGTLVDAFNEMLNQIQERDTALQRSHVELERRVEERTHELANSLSLVRATLEATTDGILVVDGRGAVTTFNEQFAGMWGFSRDVLDSRDEARMMEAALPQLKHAQQLSAKVQEVYANPETESFDLLEFNDGRLVELYSKPQRIGDRSVGRVWSFRDVTGRKRAESELRWKTAFLEAQVSSSLDGILVVDSAGKKIIQNQRMADLWKIPPHIADAEDDRQQVEFAISRTKNPQQFGEKVQHLYSHPDEVSQDEVELVDGTVLDRYSYPVIGKDGTRYGRLWMFRDITERKRSEETLRLLSSAIEQSADNIIITGRDGAINYANPAFLELTGYEAGEVIGRKTSMLKSGHHDATFYAELWATIIAGKPFRAEFTNRRKSGELYYEEKTITPVTGSGGAITHFVASGRDVTERKRTEEELDKVHKQLLETSRRAGMAEVASNVLHNVGNVLNSVNVSAAVLTEKIRGSKISSFTRVVGLLREHAADLPAFLAADAKGRQVPGFLFGLADHLVAEQRGFLEELQLLARNIEHIKDIVAMQQNYAKVAGVTETVPVVDLIEDALRMNLGSFSRHEIQVIREYKERPRITVERHKVLQVLVNLMRNAKYACDEGGKPQKQMCLRVERKGESLIGISVIDNGVGIPAENLTRIFAHGFTTRKDGHGFGLHSGALAARELGGALLVHSDGPGCGATFTLELPTGPSVPAGSKPHFTV